MKKTFCLLFFLILTACATPQMTPEQQNVTKISETNNCEFIKTAYFEVSDPSEKHYYATKITVNAGGDSYMTLTSGKDMAVGVEMGTTNIAIYKCK